MGLLRDDSRWYDLLSKFLEEYFEEATFLAS